MMEEATTLNVFQIVDVQPLTPSEFHPVGDVKGIAPDASMGFGFERPTLRIDRQIKTGVCSRRGS
jgi:hypothetical protein